MGIEEEAEEFTRRQRDNAKHSVQRAIQAARDVLTNRLHVSAERFEAMTRLQEAEMWALRCMDEYGHK